MEKVNKTIRAYINQRIGKIRKIMNQRNRLIIFLYKSGQDPESISRVSRVSKDRIFEILIKNKVHKVRGRKYEQK